MSIQIELPDIDAVGVRAANPGPFTLSGTNSWVIGREPAWLIDPGPALAEHVAALSGEIERRGGLGGIALTHDHADHAEAVPALVERYPGVPVGAARGEVDVCLGDGDAFGPLRAIATPGHSPDHLSYLAGPVGYSGDAVLGEGSVFVASYRGAMAGYLAGLQRLREQNLSLLCPGHGPLVTDPESKLSEYIAHRLDRERRLLDALASGLRTVEELLKAVWSDTPAALRPAAAWTLAAHLDKLESEERLPAGVERPALSS